VLPIEPWELPTCEYAVSIVGRLERVSPHEEWSPKTYGVFVRAGQKSGVILPGEALTHAKQVSPGQGMRLESALLSVARSTVSDGEVWLLTGLKTWSVSLGY